MKFVDRFIFLLSSQSLLSLRSFFQVDNLHILSQLIPALSAIEHAPLREKYLRVFMLLAEILRVAMARPISIYDLYFELAQSAVRC